MLTLLRRYSVLVTSGTLLLFSLVLLTANARGRRRIDPLGAVALELITPVTSLLSTIESALRHTWSGYVDLVGVRQDNEWLRRRVRELEARADRTVDVASQNSRLQALLDLREAMPGQAVAARITAADAAELFRTVILNKGERDGVAAGMAVVAPQGVVGRIIATSPNASRVLLLEDHASGVDALVERTRARGIVEGAADGGCLLKYVKRREDLQVGDRIVTSGLDNIFPKGVLIGEIVRLVRKDQGLFQTAEMQPAVDFSKLEEVLVVPAHTSEIPPMAPPAPSGVHGHGRPRS
jgi:rod shape-determining protein MreC